MYEYETKMREAKIEHERKALAERNIIQMKKEGEHLQFENKLYLAFHTESSKKKF